jgi:hypothetical protein
MTQPAGGRALQRAAPAGLTAWVGRSWRQLTAAAAATGQQAAAAAGSMLTLAATLPCLLPAAMYIAGAGPTPRVTLG